MIVIDTVLLAVDCSEGWLVCMHVYETSKNSQLIEASKLVNTLNMLPAALPRWLEVTVLSLIYATYTSTNPLYNTLVRNPFAWQHEVLHRAVATGPVGQVFTGPLFLNSNSIHSMT